MELYQRLLGGTLDLRAMNAQGASGPAGPKDRIAEARLEADGALIVASDGHPDYPPTVGDNMAVALRGTDPDKLIKTFHALADGGKTKMPLSAQSGVGYLTDRFGINWEIRIDKK